MYLSQLIMTFISITLGIATISADEQYRYRILIERYHDVVAKGVVYDQ